MKRSRLISATKSKATRNSTGMASGTDGQLSILMQTEILASNSTRLIPTLASPKVGIKSCRITNQYFCLHQNAQPEISPTSHACAISHFLTFYHRNRSLLFFINQYMYICLSIFSSVTTQYRTVESLAFLFGKYSTVFSLDSHMQNSLYGHMNVPS